MFATTQYWYFLLLQIFCLIFGFIATKQYSKRSDRLFIILSFLDFLTCAFFLIEKFTIQSLNLELCLTQMLVSSAFLYLSINLFFFILVDRYIFVIYNQFHQRHSVVMIKICSVLMLSYWLIAAGLITYSGLENDRTSLIILNIMAVTNLLLIVFLSVIFNVHLVIYIQASERNVSRTGNINHNTYHKKATYTLVTISCVLVVCYSGFIFASVYRTITTGTAFENRYCCNIDLVATIR